MSDILGTQGANSGWASANGLERIRSTAEFRQESTEGLPNRLTCPCCRHTLATGAVRDGSISCENCGGSFRLEGARPESTIDEIRVIGRFQLLDRVGRGSFGTVWRARDTQLDRIVAVKVPHLHAIGSGLDVERLGREARIAAQLRHPGIVRLYEMLTLDDVPVLVTDFIEGVPLKQVLEGRRLTFRESALLVAQTADALDHAHERGLVHRDVKPANIMIEYSVEADDLAGMAAEERGRTRLGKPIVVDFGLALRPEADMVMTVEGQIIGTPAYMSPEQAAGRVHQVDRRSDIYSLGVVLYQLLCGELPFRGSKVMLVHQLLHEDPRAPRRVNDRVPRDLETICLKALAKLPSRRYATAGELADDLRRFLDGQPCRARPVGRLERGRLWAMRNPALAAAGAVAAILLLAVVAVSLVAAVRERRHADELRLALGESKYRLAENYLDRGLFHCERGEVAFGMLLLARALSEAPPEAGDLCRVLRANQAGWQVKLDPLRAIWSNGGPITAVVFSPDGKLAAIADKDHMVRLWDGAQGRPVAGPIDCSDEVRSLAFSPDGRELAIACRAGRVRFWDVHRGRFFPTILDHGQNLYAIAYSHDGKTLATGGRGRRVKLWDTASARPLAIALAHERPITMVAFTPDDRAVVTATADGTIQLWDAKSGSLGGHPAIHEQLQSAALSPDGRRLATGGRDGSARLWDAASLELLHVLPHPSVVHAIAFSPDSRTLLTGCADKVARLWDVASGEGLGPAAYHRQAIAVVAFDPEGSRIFTGSDDGICQIRRRGHGRSRDLELAHRAGVDVVAVGPDGRVALTGTKPFDGSEAEAQLWELPTGKALGRWIHSGMITAAAFSPDGRTVATASADRTVSLRDVASGERLCPPLQHEGWVHAVAFSPDGTRVLTGCEDGSARLWDARSGRLVGPSFAHEQAVVTLAFSPDGTLAATGSSDSTARLWDVASGGERRVFRHRGLVRTVSFSPDGTTLLTASLDHTARLWRVDSGQPLGRALVHQDEVMCAAFSPDGTTVLTGSKDNTGQLWRVATTSPLGAPLMHEGPIYSVAYNPDRTTVATASGDATVRLWDLATGRRLGPALRHRGLVAGMAFAPDGRRLITGSRDKAARIWDLPRTFDASPRRSTLWVQTLCGMEMTGNEAIGLLTPDEWRKRRQELDELGGSPIAED